MYTENIDKYDYSLLKLINNCKLQYSIKNYKKFKEIYNIDRIKLPSELTENKEKYDELIMRLTEKLNVKYNL